MSQSTLRVLVIESDENERLSLAEIFSTHGFDVTLAENEKSAHQQIDTQNFLAVIAGESTCCSETAPFALFDKLANLELRPVVIVLSASTPRFSFTELYQHNVEALFTKPITAMAIEDLLRMAVSPRPGVRNIRAFSRANARFVLEVSVFGSGVSFVTHTDNVAQGGLFFAVKRDLAPSIGTNISFVLHPGDDSEPLHGKGSVTWTRTNGERIGCGIQFDKNSRDIEKILKLVNTVKTQRRH